MPVLYSQREIFSFPQTTKLLAVHKSLFSMFATLVSWDHNPLLSVLGHVIL